MMNRVIPLPAAVDVSGPVTQDMLTQLTTAVLGTYFKGDLNALLKSYADFCVSHGTEANRYSHLEWACDLLNIKIEKDIAL